MRQSDIYKKAEISKAMISLILAGKRAPSWNMAKKLQKVTGVDIVYWMESKKASKQLNDQLVKKGYEYGNK